MKRELRGLRMGAGLTQQQLADILGVTHISVSRWETGKSIPSPKYIKALADLFGVQGKDIFFVGQPVLFSQCRNGTDGKIL